MKALGIIAAFILMVWFFGGEPTSGKAEMTASDASLSCFASVRAKLRAPSTGVFTAYKELGKINDNALTLLVSVTHENEYGGKVDSQFRCKTEYADGQWTVFYVGGPR